MDDSLLIQTSPILLGIFAVIISVVVNPHTRLLMKNFFFFLLTELKRFCYGLYERFKSPVPNINVALVPVDGNVVNAIKIDARGNGWKFNDCPPSVWIRRKVDSTLEIEVGSFDEKCIWICWPSVDFYVGKNSGRIKKMIVKYRYIRIRGQWFRNACSKTEWAKYYNSVVMAHIEVLKYSQRRLSHHPTLIARIFKEYGETFFQQVA